MSEQLTESRFEQLVESFLEQLESVVEESGADLDFDTIQGVLTIFDEQNVKVIVSRQTALKQLWVAAVGGGYHFNFVSDYSIPDAMEAYVSGDKGVWVEEKSAETIFVVLNRIFASQYDVEKLF